MSYCKLYIDTKYSREETEQIINSTIKHIYHTFKDTAEDRYWLYDEEIPHISYVNSCLYNNDYHDPSFEVGKKLCCVRAKFYANLYDEFEEGDDREIFIKMIIESIKILRQKLEYVVASCGFEDVIFKETGWNWTAKKPLPCNFYQQDIYYTVET